jgi:cobalt-zinc-cadmium resistance protein CzcA
MRHSLIILCCLSFGSVFGQEVFSLQQAVEHARKNNLALKSAQYHVDAQKELGKTSFDLPKTEVSLMYGQYNSYAQNDNNITISQSIPFVALGSQGRLNRSLLTSAQLGKAVTESEVVYEVKKTYYSLAHAYALKNLLLRQDTIFEEFYRNAEVRYKAGEANLLEQVTAEAHKDEAKNRVHQIDGDIGVLRSKLRVLLNTDFVPDITDRKVARVPLTTIFDETLTIGNPSLAYFEQQREVALAEKKVQGARATPDLVVGYFNQTLIGTVNPESLAQANASQRFSGFQVGVAIPLWFVPHRGRLRAADYNMRSKENDYTSFQRDLAGQLEQTLHTFGKSQHSLKYYEETGLPNADLILKQSQTAFRNGEIGYAEYLLGLRNAITVAENYLRTLAEYNQSIIFIEFLSGNKSN